MKKSNNEILLKKMLSKQRIHHNTNFQEPDKVPAHMNATRWVVGKLKKALQVNSDKELLKALNNKSSYIFIT